MSTHEHNHAHHHGASTGGRLTAALGLTLGFSFVEAIGGWISGSLALLGDAGHMLSDSFALGLAALAAWVARRPPSFRHSYGFGRMEVVAALFNALLMLGVVGGIAWAAIQRFQAPAEVQGGMVMLVASFGLAINLLVAWVLGHGEQNLNVRGALLHVLGDLLGSVAALVSGAVIVFTGWTPIDPILALLVCVLILISTLRLLRDSVHVVLEGVPFGIELPEVGRAMAEVNNVRSVHDLHIWTLSSGSVALSAHVVLGELQHWESALEELNGLLLEEFGIDHTTIQPETDTHILHPVRPAAAEKGRMQK